jgi:cysteine synthase A
MGSWGPEIASSITDLIGQTPLVRLSRLAPEGNVLLKLELSNPSGSVKDRAALAMITAAERSRKLTPGGHIVEATSGNTGIALAMIAAVRGYACTIVMPDDASVERRKVLAAYGAEVVLTPRAEGMRGAVVKAAELTRERNAFSPTQFVNQENPLAHESSTAEEILQAIPDVAAFVAGVGTGGTLTGVGRVLLRRQPGVRIVAVEPEGCSVLSGGSPGPHRLFGLGAGFVPEVLDRTVIHEVVVVKERDALAARERLATKEGIFGGPSTGANVHVALGLAGNVRGPIVTIACDLGDRYLAE